MLRPSRFWPFIPSIASLIACSLLKVTNPNPLDLPVSLSFNASMAFPTFIPSQNLITSNPLSPSFPSPLTSPIPFISHRTILKPSAQIPSHQNQSPELEPSTSSVDPKNNNNKKKLRPSFYDQTLERWSLKVSSQRSKFPWQEQKTTNKVKDNVLDDSRNTHLDSELGFENPVRKFGTLDKGSGKSSRLDLVIEKLGSSEKTHVRDVSRLGIPGRVGVHAPWVHSAKSREAHLGFGALQSQEGSVVDGEDDEKQDDSPFGQKNTKASLNYGLRNLDKEEGSNSNKIVEKGPISNAVMNPIEDEEDVQAASRIPLQSLLEFGVESEKSRVSFIVDQLQSSLDRDQNIWSSDVSSSSSDKVHHRDQDVVKLTGPVPLPWERNHGDEQLHSHKRSNTVLAERTIPEPELRRLRNVALRMKERMKVGAAGVTEAVVESIHKKWKVEEVVKLRFEGPPTLNMKRTHEILERRTGGIVIWRSGSSVVLYRGMTYELPCVKSYEKLAGNNKNNNQYSSKESISDAVTNKTDGLVRVSKSPDAIASTSFSAADLCGKGSSTETLDADSFLDELGPRYKDWSGCNPIPVDADRLPGVVPGYEPPFRLLPYKTKSGLKNRQMTSFRRLARAMTPHFALGRNRQHQGLARAMVKLWEKSAIAKIAIKRGVPNTRNERMAEEIKKLTGGVLVSRNKEYIVFYRGNDFLTPSVRNVIVEKQKEATLQLDEEEVARLRASASIASNAKTAKGPLLAGTLAETLEAKTQWGQHQPSTEDKEKMKRDFAFAKHASLVRFLERKLALAKSKVRKAEKALMKVQKFLTPAELPTDLETVTDEERALYRKMGLKMRAYLLLGRRGVFDGTVENMHLSWKHRELVKIFVKGKKFAQVKHIAVSLEAESGGILISLDKTTKGYAIVIYRGKNYQRPHALKPANLLTKRQALARSIELQRREALNHHISELHERIQMMKSQLDEMNTANQMENEHSDIKVDDNFPTDEDSEDEGEEAYLETYCGSDDDDDDDDAASQAEEFYVANQHGI